MPQVPPLPLTPSTLTDALREFGAVGSSSIADVRVTERIETSVSNLWFLSVTWSPRQSPVLPGRLLLKWPLAVPSSPVEGQAEPRFYRHFAPRLRRPVTVPALATSPVGDNPWCLLEDVRATHQHPAWPGRPEDHELVSAVLGLAHVHARWWDAREPGAEGLSFHTEDSLRAMVAGIARHLPAFLDYLGKDLGAADRAVLETVFSSSLRPWLRIADRTALTLAHGDAHTWNFLFPQSAGGNTYLIDWQTWHRDVGARDLAYMMALHWNREVRQRLERPLLEHYYDRLLEEGITGYAFDDLWLEYRRCAIRNLTFPIIYWSRGFPPEAWRYRLSCALAAYRDLGAADLL